MKRELILFFLIVSMAEGKIYQREVEDSPTILRENSVKTVRRQEGERGKTLFKKREELEHEEDHFKEIYSDNYLPMKERVDFHRERLDSEIDNRRGQLNDTVDGKKGRLGNELRYDSIDGKKGNQKILDSVDGKKGHIIDESNEKQRKLKEKIVEKRKKLRGELEEKSF